jgi:hypothetical protein
MMTIEVTDYSCSPRSFGFRGIDGLIRPIGKGSIEPLEDGMRSGVTMELVLKGHGVGKLFLMLGLRQARREMPRNQQHLKERLEGTSTEANSLAARLLNARARALQTTVSAWKLTEGSRAACSETALIE